MYVFAGRFTVFALTTPDDLRFTSRRISVRGLTLQCAIGAYEHERNRLQKVRLDCDVWVPLRPTQDRLENVLNYDWIVDAMRTTALSGHIDLQETLVDRMADALCTHPDILLVRVASAKLEAYADVESVGLEVWRRPDPRS